MATPTGATVKYVDRINEISQFGIKSPINLMLFQDENGQVRYPEIKKFTGKDCTDRKYESRMCTYSLIDEKKITDPKVGGPKGPLNLIKELRKQGDNFARNFVARFSVSSLVLQYPEARAEFWKLYEDSLKSLNGESVSYLKIKEMNGKSDKEKISITIGMTDSGRIGVNRVWGDDVISFYHEYDTQNNQLYIRVGQDKPLLAIGQAAKDPYFGFAKVLSEIAVDLHRLGNEEKAYGLQLLAEYVDPEREWPVGAPVRDVQGGIPFEEFFFLSSIQRGTTIGGCLLTFSEFNRVLCFPTPNMGFTTCVISRLYYKNHEIDETRRVGILVLKKQ